MQYDRKCAFLNEQFLCDLQAEAGEEALCSTCREYPRHVEEFEGVREYSLSLSCPEAARIMLTEKGKSSFVQWEDEKEDEFEEDFDFLLYTRLLEAREILFSVMEKKMSPSLCVWKNVCFFCRKTAETPGGGGFCRSGRMDGRVCL